MARATKNETSDVSKVTANLPNEDILRLDSIAKKHATTKTAALVRAIRTTKFLEDAEAEGGSVFIKDKDGTLREVVFK
ncbi:hypothetical protein G6038_30120 [Rhodococcus sp. 14C212]|uniref:hypothetical protein n=1 Tax=Rhodococcus sp. 14C212 TaxID=2711209 RepID=UPI0013ECC51E|nr:hypothetical protein [Rhodococcus sp. 14C212]NGP09646.1 hypothetical protein [Rhodococcus sp. 14C212]